MTFDETTARELIAKYSLKPNTINIWKLRGIPDRYADPNYAPKAALSAYEKKQEQALINALRNPKLNMSQVARETNTNINVIMSAIRQDKKRMALTADQILSLKKNVQELRIKTKSIIEPLAGRDRFTDTNKSALDNLLLDPRFVRRAIFGGNTETYNRHIQRHSPTLTTIVFDDKEASDMVDKLSIFLLETSL